MNQLVRVRFSPSSTGPLHIGGARTALYNWIIAKKYQGTFILRIEDTDQKRFVPTSEAHITKTLQWLDIYPDESPDKGGDYGPYRQSERKALYQEYALKLVKEGKAYYAFDTPEELDDMRIRFKAQGMIAPQYNAITRMQMKNALTLSEAEVNHKIATGQPYVIRMLIDPKLTLRAKDKLRGWIQLKGEDLEDKVLLKADGMATYHMANIVDDHLMKITHVIRGEEWLPSLAYHILLYQYFGWEAPEFVHLPLLLNPNGRGKLSKRATQQGDTLILPISWQDPLTGQTISGFREEGYLPEALLNFIVLLGWHPSNNQELFTKEELIQHFSLSRISKAGARLDMNKARWFNQKYMQNIQDNLLATRYLLPALEKEGIPCTLEHAARICRLIKKGITFPYELVKNSGYFFHAPEPAAIKKEKTWDKPAQEFFIKTTKNLANLNQFDPSSLQASIQKQIAIQHIKTGEGMQLIRLALTGTKVGPPLAELLSILGKKEVLQRANNLIGWF